MQQLEKLILQTRDASPTGRIAAVIAPDGDAIEFRALSLCEHCGGEIALHAGFEWSEWGWHRGDYNRAQAYADSVTYAHHAQFDCTIFNMHKRSNK